MGLEHLPNVEIIYNFMSFEFEIELVCISFYVDFLIPNLPEDEPLSKVRNDRHKKLGIILLNTPSPSHPHPQDIGLQYRLIRKFFEDYKFHSILF